MSDANSKRAVAYLRVSSISQVDGHSLNAQERLFNQLCESRSVKGGEKTYQRGGAKPYH